MIDYKNDYGVKLSQQMEGASYVNGGTINVSYYVNEELVSYWVDLGNKLEYQTLGGEIVTINKP